MPRLGLFFVTLIANTLLFLFILSFFTESAPSKSLSNTPPTSTIVATAPPPPVIIQSPILTIDLTPPPPSKESILEPTITAEYYTMKPGDSLWKIAKNHGTGVKELLLLNGIDDRKAKQLKPGDQIRIR